MKNTVKLKLFESLSSGVTLHAYRRNVARRQVKTFLWGNFNSFLTLEYVHSIPTQTLVIYATAQRRFSHQKRRFY